MKLFYQRFATLLVVLMGLSLITSGPANEVSAATCNIQLGAFTKSVAYIVAQREGYFAQEGLSVCFNQATSSVQLFNDFSAGKFQIIAAASDNTINRVVNSKLPISLINGIELGSDQVLAGNTANGINTIADLRGKAIAVDAPDSGFVFVLRKILANNGLFLENNDYSFQLVGGTPIRFNAITAGVFKGEKVYGTVLVWPLTARIASPVSVLARAEDFVVPYQSAGLSVTTDFARKNPATVTAFLRAMIKGHQFSRLPENRDTVINYMMAELSQTQPVASANLDASLNLVTGENKNLQMSKKGLINTIKLRQEFNGFTTPLSDKEIKKLAKPTKNGLYDDTYWRAAAKSLNLDDDDDHDDEDDDHED